MKKFALATLLALSTSTAFAGFNSNGNNGGYQQAAGKTISVKQALSAADNSMVTLEGNITQQTGDDDYLFQDATGQIKVEIKNRVWNGLNISANDKVRISGKLDNEAFERAEVEVYSIQKAN